MLGCWAAAGDVMNTGACAEASGALFQCMRETVRMPFSSCFALPLNAPTNSLSKASSTNRPSTTISHDSGRTSNRPILLLPHSLCNPVPYVMTYPRSLIPLCFTSTQSHTTHSTWSLAFGTDRTWTKGLSSVRRLGRQLSRRCVRHWMDVTRQGGCEGRYAIVDQID